MKIIRFGLYIAISFILCTMLLLVWGESGVRAYRQLQEYSLRLQNNIKGLERTNSDLLTELDALGHDPEAIALKARELGFMKEDEQLIRIEGYGSASTHYTVGRILRRSRRPENRDNLIKLFALVLPFLLYLLSLIGRRESGRTVQRRDWRNQ